MRTTKSILLFLILLSLLISPLQLHYKFFGELPLKGYYSQNKLPDLKYFTWSRWFSSVFQEDFSSRMNDNIGFHNSLIRLGNQFDYSLFGLTHAKGFIEGKNRYLFEEDYIHEYNGDYFIGTAAIDKKLARLKNAMDSLNAHHIPLLLVYEPGKASFYPEFIPNRFLSGKEIRNNYNYFVQRSEKLGLPFLDLNNYFLKMKDTSRFPLFPRYGMHWSVYGVSLAVDTLVKSIEKATGKNMPKFQVQKVIRSQIPLGTDNDIGKLLNLACKLNPTPGVYPRIAFDASPSRSLSALVIADSYYINIAETYGRKLFRNQDYWYYNKKIYPYQNSEPPPYVDKTNLPEKLKKYDVVLLMVSEINLHCGFWNFADEVFLAFHPEVKDPLVYGFENQIRNEREWFQFVSNRAVLEQMPLEKMIRSNAEFFFYTYYKDLPGKGYWDTIQYITINIRNNAEWLAQITKNAQNEHMPIDTALKLNAIYSYDQSKKNH